MPLAIHGWVEIIRQDESLQSQEHWEAVINIGALIDVADSVSERLFGLSKPAVGDPINVAALAANRGVPPNPSKEFCRDLEEVRDLEGRFGKGEFGGYTFAGWHEVVNLGLSDAELDSSDWRLVFELVQTLAKDQRLSADKIRLVTYFSW